MKNFKPRKWQSEALELYLQSGAKDFLAVVTPGGGKTIWGLWVAVNTQAERLIVVCPTTAVKRQWEDEGKRQGINISNLERCESNHIATTYQQVAANPELFAELVGEMKSIVIFDEIHHASDANTWGQLIQQAFGEAYRRLCLTGTAFRSDDGFIPFVNYEDGTCVPDFVYSYREAVRDGVCRDLVPHVFGGEIGWIREGEDEERRHTFSDALKGKDKTSRLTAALKVKGGFIRSMLESANSCLQSYPGEGGLIIAKSTNHANAIADLMEQMTGEKPVVVHSGLANPHQRLEAFRAGNGRWLVAVQMVAEGVDIERLRVLVYVTNIATEMFIRQSIGRVIRRTGEAHVYFPAHDPFVRVIDEIEDEKFHAIKERDAGCFLGSGGSNRGQRKEVEMTYSEGWEIGNLRRAVEGRIVEQRCQIVQQARKHDADYRKRKAQESGCLASVPFGEHGIESDLIDEIKRLRQARMGVKEIVDYMNENCDLFRCKNSYRPWSESSVRKVCKDNQIVKPASSRKYPLTPEEKALKKSRERMRIKQDPCLRRQKNRKKEVRKKRILWASKLSVSTGLSQGKCETIIKHILRKNDGAIPDKYKLNRCELDAKAVISDFNLT